MRLDLGRLTGSRQFTKLLYLVVRLYSWTFRLRVVNERILVDHLESGGRALICAWHQQFFSGIHYFHRYEQYRLSLMISQSRDGELIAGVATHGRLYPVRGSSSKGGGKALRQMIFRLKKYRLGAHILDGPRGPMGHVKGGVIRLGHAADAALVPFQVKADRAWLFRSWDRFMLPKPFARVEFRFGPLIHHPRTRDKKELERQRQELEDTMRPFLMEKKG